MQMRTINTIEKEDISKKYNQFKQAIDFAINEKNYSYLRETIDTLDAMVPETPFEECYKLETILEYYVACVTLVGEYDVSKQMHAWGAFRQSNTPLSLISGLDYIINQFCKTAYQAHQHQLIIKAHFAISHSFDYLQCESLNKQKDILETFNKKLTIYMDLALKEQGKSQTLATPIAALPETSHKNVTLRPLAVVENTYTLDLSNLEGIKGMDKVAARKAQLVLQAMLTTCDNKLFINQQDSLRNAIDISITIAAEIICGLYACEDGAVHEEHKKHVLNEFRKSALHHYRKNPSQFKNNKAQFLNIISSQFVGIFLRSFPIIETSVAMSIINQMMNSLIQASNVNKANEVINQIIDLVKIELQIFAQRYPGIYALYKKCNDKFCENNDKKDEIIELENEIRKCIADIIPQQCMNIIACFYDKSVITNLLLLLDDDVNAKKYRKKVIESYKDARRFWPSYYPQINVLYNANIHIYEVDTELNDIIKKIKFDLVSLKKKTARSNIKSLNEAIFKNIELYIGYYIYNQMRIVGEAIPYQPDQSFSLNILRLVNVYFNTPQLRENHRFVISCCQAMEQLFKGCEFESRVPDIYLATMREIIGIKLHALRTLMDILKSKNSDLSIGELQLLIAQFGQQYVDGSVFLDGHNNHITVEDTYLVEVLERLFDHYRGNGRNEKAASYIDRGIFLLPDNISLLQKKIVIEEETLETEMLKINEHSIIELAQMSLFIEETNNLCDKLVVPDLIQNTNKNEKVVAEYIQLVSQHKNVTAQYNAIMNDKSSLALNIEKYHGLLKSFKTHIKMETSSFTNVKINVVKNHLNKINLLQSKQGETTKYYEKCRIMYKKIKSSVESYEKKLLDFKSNESQLKSLIMQEIARALRMAEANKEKARRKAEAKMEIKKEIKAEVKMEVKKEVKTQVKTEASAEVHAVENAEIVIESMVETPVEVQSDTIPQIDSEKIKDYQDSPTHALIKFNLFNDKMNCKGKALNEGDHITNNNDHDVTETLNIEIPNLIQIEIDAVSDDILLNGAGSAVSAKALNTVTDLDKALRLKNSHVVGYGSLKTRFCIHYFNENKEIAKLFPVNDIDLYIPFHPDVNIQDVESILEHDGFQIEKNENVFGFHPYVNYVKEVDGIKIDLTFIKHPSYISFEPIILRMGSMECCYFENDVEYKKAVASGRMIVKADKNFFEIKLPNKYENEFIQACKLNEFAMLKPDTRFRGYSVAIYNSAVKLLNCVLLENFNTGIQSSLDVIHYHDVCEHLIKYYDEQLQMQNISCYLELNEFIKKGINPESHHLAMPLISAFFYSFINYQLNQWTQVGLFKNQWANEDIEYIADHCADIFINSHCITRDKKTDIEFDLRQEVYNIMNYAMGQYQIMLYQTSYQDTQYAYQGTLYPSKQHENDDGNVSQQEDQQNELNRGFTYGFSCRGFN